MTVTKYREHTSWKILFKNAFEGSLNDDLNKTKLFPILTVTLKVLA